MQKVRADCTIGFTQRELEQIAEWARRNERASDTMPWALRQVCLAAADRPSEPKSTRWGDLTEKQIKAARDAGCSNETEYLEKKAQADALYRRRLQGGAL